MRLRNKGLALILLLALLTLAGCGSGANENTSASAESEAVQALDLQGSWIAEVQGSGYYLAGFIKDDLIELHWVASYDQNGSVYWAGSYDAPTEDVTTYTWESSRNEGIMATSYYASVDDVRTFSYADGKLTLQGSATATEVVLIPSETDYTYLAVDAPESSSTSSSTSTSASADDAAAAVAEEVQDIELVNSGYSVESIGSGNSLIYYAVEIANPNEYNAILSPNIAITVRGEDGRVLTRQHRSLAGVAPGDSFIFGDVISCPKGKPAEVEITVENNDYDFVPFAGSGIHAVGDFSVSEISEDRSGSRATFSGTVTNSAASDATGVLVSLVFYMDGDIVGGLTTELGTIAAGASSDFTLEAKSGFSAFDSYEVTVTQEAE